MYFAVCRWQTLQPCVGPGTGNLSWLFLSCLGPFGFLVSKDFELIGLSIFWLGAYLIKVIPETRHVHGDFGMSFQIRISAERSSKTVCHGSILTLCSTRKSITTRATWGPAELWWHSLLSCYLITVSYANFHRVWLHEFGHEQQFQLTLPHGHHHTVHVKTCLVCEEKIGPESHIALTSCQSSVAVAWRQ